MPRLYRAEQPVRARRLVCARCAMPRLYRAEQRKTRH